MGIDIYAKATTCKTGGGFLHYIIYLVKTCTVLQPLTQLHRL